MMRGLFILFTTGFWLAVAGFWSSPLWLPPEDVATEGPAANTRTVTLAEVARHGQQADCWMAINGQVHDLTAYLPLHPADLSLMLDWCGRDATEAYRTKTKGRPHSPFADQLLLKYRIGTLGEGR